ncbi:hypothetical protein N0V95_002297 [Ascochyta clinopodiicola]|nr:hypothetical protein N0V95_002297 [Ascochyta clinopodiicola]
MSASEAAGHSKLQKSQAGKPGQDEHPNDLFAGPQRLASAHYMVINYLATSYENMDQLFGTRAAHVRMLTFMNGTRSLHADEEQTRIQAATKQDPSRY